MNKWPVLSYKEKSCIDKGVGGDPRLKELRFYTLSYNDKLVVYYLKESKHKFKQLSAGVAIFSILPPVLLTPRRSALISEYCGKFSTKIDRAAIRMAPWHSLYKHSLYVTKFIRTFFIRDNVYTGQSLYRTKFIQGQSLYGDKVYTGTKFIWDKVYMGQSLYRTKFIQGQSLYGDKVYTGTKFIQTFCMPYT